jgi:hypothetical protein
MLASALYALNTQPDIMVDGDKRTLEVNGFVVAGRVFRAEIDADDPESSGAFGVGYSVSESAADRILCAVLSMSFWDDQDRTGVNPVEEAQRMADVAHAWGCEFVPVFDDAKAYVAYRMIAPNKQPMKTVIDYNEVDDAWFTRGAVAGSDEFIEGGFDGLKKLCERVIRAMYWELRSKPVPRLPDKAEPDVGVG